jgi:hypothetical protein
MKTVIVSAVLAFVFAIGCFAGQTKTVYKVFRLTDSELAVTCQNGADPAIAPKPYGKSALIISCGE